jgi:hypothetical protein
MRMELKKGLKERGVGIDIEFERSEEEWGRSCFIEE